MTDGEWATCTDPAAMLDFLRQTRRASERKLRLFAAACCRRSWELLTDKRSRRAVELAEAHADGLVGRTELQAAREAAVAAWYSVRAARGDEVAAWAPVTASSRKVMLENGVGEGFAAAGTKVEVLRDLFSPVPSPVGPSVLAWQDGLVARLAGAAYEDRLLPSGHLDPDRLAVLADALEEAGCTDAELLGHLRGPGPHTRGCWAVDAVTGRA
jgi:hypothetical protein